MDKFQSVEQRAVPDAVAKLRKCGLEGELSLPQLVVCGDQSSGKSSVLEALTAIPFPRADNLCTRVATEIILRNAPRESLTIKVIPDVSSHSKEEQETILAFSMSITDLAELPEVMEKTIEVMSIGSLDGKYQFTKVRAFTRDVLSIEFEGPTQPQLTLVDLPGLIQNESKGVTEEDVRLVRAITDHYIRSPRTICLAVIAAGSDYSNQSILSKVMKADPDGIRSLGIITKLDKLDQGSQAQVKYIELANNEDVKFELGWHVVKNREFKESDFSLAERKISEAKFFAKSAWSSIFANDRGIENLIERLSILLTNHIRRELPVLQEEVRTKIFNTESKLATLELSRSTVMECRTYLTKFAMDLHDIVSSAVKGEYDDPFFCMDYKDELQVSIDDGEGVFCIYPPCAIHRLRAVLQLANRNLGEKIRLRGHAWEIMDDSAEEEEQGGPPSDCSGVDSDSENHTTLRPEPLSRDEALAWIGRAITKSSGEELEGTFNPRIIPQLFREQAQHWSTFAIQHLNAVHDVCAKFVATVVLNKPSGKKIMQSQVEAVMSGRKIAAENELMNILSDMAGLLTTYNHYSTDNAQEMRKDQEGAKTYAYAGDMGLLGEDEQSATPSRVRQMIENWKNDVGVNQARKAQSDALDHMLGVYKVKQKVFVDNVTTQVIQRHLVRSLEEIFTPITVTQMTDDEVQVLAGEPKATRRERVALTEKLEKLSEGQGILDRVMRSSEV